MAIKLTQVRGVRGEDEATAAASDLQTSQVASSSTLRILVWIRIWIRGYMPLTNGSGSGSYFFRHWPSRRQQKTYLIKSFSAYYFLKIHLHRFSKIKSQKEVTKQKELRFFLLFFLIEGLGSGAGSIPMTNGSGAGSRGPKNIRIRIRIRICNTSCRYAFV